MFNPMGSTNPQDLGNGGEIDGNLSITGDLTVSGGIALTLNEVLQGTSTIDINSTEALLVRKDGDGGDVFIVDTTNSIVTTSGDIKLSGNDKNISWGSDTHNMIYGSSSGDYLKLQANNQLKLTLNSTGAIFENGLVGIGTASPAKELQVEQSTHGADTTIRLRALNAASGAGRSCDFKWDPDNRSMEIGESGELVIKEGKVGIGTSPSSLLSIKGQDPTFTIESNRDNVSSSEILGQIDFRTNEDSFSGEPATSARIKVVENNYAATTMSFHTSTNPDDSLNTAMTITSGGAVGIGVTDPSESLEVNGSGANLKVVSDDNVYLSLDSTQTNGDEWQIFNANSGSTSTLQFKNIDQSKVVMLMDETGKVGIGNTSPVDLLHVGAGADSPAVDSVAIFTHTGTTNVAIRDASSDVELLNYAYSGGGLIGTVTNHDLSIRTNNTNRLTITSGGNISINDSSSIKQLNVLDTDNAAGRFTRSTASATTGHLSDAFVVRGKTGGDMADGFGTMIAFEINDSANSDNSIGGCGMMRDGADNSGKFFIANNNAGTYATNFYVDKTGKVGIGVSDPSEEIEVKASGDSCIAINTSTATNDAQLKFFTGDTEDWIIYADGSATNDPLMFYDANGTAGIRFVLDANSRISLSNNDAGASGRSYNTIFGYLAGDDLQGTGLYNSFFGDKAGHAITTGDYNTAIGLNALDTATVADRVTAIGTATLRGAVTADAQGAVAVGYGALNQLTTAQNSTAVGYSAGYAITVGDHNTILGHEALKSEVGGQNSVAIGSASLYTQDGGDSDTAMDNIGIGRNTGYHNVTGTKNVYVGSFAGQGASGQSNSGNVGIGYSALLDTTTANYNTAVGNIAMENITTGSTNVAVGSRALSTATTATYCVGVGGDALFGIPAGEAVTGAVAIGIEAFKGDSNTTAAANGTVAIGQGALKYLQTGAGNVAVGYTALGNCTSGGSNIAIGDTALEDLVTGGANVAIGRNAGKEMGAAENGNILIGMAAGQSLDEGTNGTIDSNIAIGKDSFTGGNLNTASTAIVGNIAIGTDALNSTGTNAQTGAIAIGYQSLTALISGEKNVAIGYESGKALETGERNVIIGYQAGLTTTNVDGAVIIGNYAGVSNMTQDADGTVAIGRSCGTNITSGIGNTAVGYGALYGEDDGDYNTAIGYAALNSQTGTSGTVGNTALGYKAGYAITTGTQNVLLGSSAGDSLTSGSNNVVIGYEAFDAANAGEAANVAIGYSAMGAVDETINSGAGVHSADNNVAIGYNALLGGVIGGGDVNDSTDRRLNHNIAIGYGSLDATGQNASLGQIAIGYDALGANTSGYDNLAIGYQSLDACTTGSQNVALGRGALGGTDDGVSNTALGAYAMTGNVGTSNTAVGAQAMVDSTGSYNTAVGMQSLFDCVGGGSNTALGALALKLANGGESDNVAVGVQAMQDFQENGNTGDYNIAIGTQALLGGTAGGDVLGNIAIGHHALNSTDTAAVSYVVAIGYNAATALNHSDASGSVFIGRDCGLAITQGQYNVMVGQTAGAEETVGDRMTFVGHRAGRRTGGLGNLDNTFIGWEAGSGDWSSNSSSCNTVVGSNAFYGNCDGANYNTAVGYKALEDTTSGDANTMVGYQAGDGITLGGQNTGIGSDVAFDIDADNQTAIGYNATTASTGANTIMMGGSSMTDIYMGDNGNAWSTTSDGRLKENIENWNVGLDAINGLRIVSYTFKKDNPHGYDSEKKRQGIIAQEAQKVLPEMIKDDGKWLSANTEPMVWALVKAVQELSAKVEDLEKQLKDK